MGLVAHQLRAGWVDRKDARESLRQAAPAQLGSLAHTRLLTD